MNIDDLRLVHAVRALLATGPDLSAAQLRSATGKSQSSISLALLGLGGEVQKLGAARSTRYALTQDILGLAASQAVSLTSAAGDSLDFWVLTFLKSNRVHVRGPGSLECLATARLPWFLTPLQPQGFLGRELARLRPCPRVGAALPGKRRRAGGFKRGDAQGLWAKRAASAKRLCGVDLS